jgi:hypothetical protein
MEGCCEIILAGEGKEYLCWCQKAGSRSRARLCEEPVRNQPSWSVDKDAMVLGFSSFGKLLTYEISTKGTGRKGTSSQITPL